MGLWKEIKYALNSSLGKRNFVPLDELIKSFRHLVATDTVLFSAKILKQEFGTSDKNNRTLVAKINFKMSGEVRIAANPHKTGIHGYSETPYYSLDIEKNEEVVYSSGSREVLTSPDGDYYDISELISVDVNDTVSVYVTLLTDIYYEFPLKITNLYILGQISDTPIFNV